MSDDAYYMRLIAQDRELRLDMAWKNGQYIKKLKRKIEYQTMIIRRYQSALTNRSKER